MKTYSRKQNYLKTLIEWKCKFISKISSSYIITRREEYNAELLEKTLSTLSAKQLQTVNALVAAAYAYGCESTREYWVPKHHNLRDKLQNITKEEVF